MFTFGYFKLVLKIYNKMDFFL